MKVRDVIQFLEQKAPLSYQESYDNAGLITGSGSEEVKGVLVTLDCTEEVVEEAISKGYNLVVAHHPIVFKGLKRFNGRNYVERTVIKAIKNDICIYAIHTNLDSVDDGVNAKIGELIGLENMQILSPKKGTLLKLTTFVPHQYKDKLLEGLSKAGAGHIGNYEECSFQSQGVGTFKPNEASNPFMGETGKKEFVEETKVEVILPAYLKGKVLAAMRANHPYEEVAYYLNTLENTHQDVGSGMFGMLPEAKSLEEFLKHLKQQMNLSVIKFTKSDMQTKVKKVAVCGGSGSFLLGVAKGAGADIFITSDFKYHEFFDAENRIVIADIGHYESEVFTKNLLSDWLTQQFPSLEVVLSAVDTNPVTYFI